MNHIVAAGIQARGRPYRGDINERRIESLADHHARCLTARIEILWLGFRNSPLGRFLTLRLAALCRRWCRRASRSLFLNGFSSKGDAKDEQPCCHGSSESFHRSASLTLYCVLQLLLCETGLATAFVLGATRRRNAFCFQSFTSANTPNLEKYRNRPNVPFGCEAPGPPGYVSVEHVRVSG